MRHPLPSLAVLAALVTALPAAPAQAQRRAGERSTEKAARKHYERGRVHHERHEYELAVREYERAYDLEPTPALLFNIAQVYLLSGKREKALEHYRKYVVLEPEGEVSDLARQRIAEIEQELGQALGQDADEELETPDLTDESAAGAGAAGGVPTGPAAGDADAGRASAGAGSPGHGLRVAGLVTAGLGLASVGLGVKFGLDASRIQDDIEGQPDGTPWSFDARYAEGEAASRNMWIAYGVGAAALVAGGALYVLGRSAGRAEERRWAIAPVWGASGSGLVLVGGF